MTRAPFLKIALLLWAPIALWYLAAFFFGNENIIFHQVDIFYYNAANGWLHQQPLYNGEGNSFVYFPTTAILLSPLALLPVKLFEVLFRVASIAVLTLGIYQFIAQTNTENPKRVFIITLLATVLTSQAAIFVGQLHVMTTGVLLLAYAALARDRLWFSAILLTLALALKPTSIVLVLLAGLLFPKLSIKLLLMLLIFFALSFITQSPSYVLNQYLAFANSFHVAMHHDANNPQQWATFFGMLAFYYKHWAINGTPQFIVRLLLAGFIFIMCLSAKIKCEKRQALYFIVAFGMMYLMLFNSRTESNDYVMIAPMLGYSLALAWQAKKRLAVMGLGIGIILIAASWNISKWLTPDNNIWINPSVVLLYFIYLIRECDFAKSHYYHSNLQ